MKPLTLAISDYAAAALERGETVRVTTTEGQGFRVIPDAALRMPPFTMPVADANAPLADFDRELLEKLSPRIAAGQI